MDSRAAILQGRVRLSHIRRVARSIICKSSRDQIGFHQNFAKMGSVEQSNCNRKSDNHNINCCAVFGSNNLNFFFYIKLMICTRCANWGI